MVISAFTWIFPFTGSNSATTPKDGENMDQMAEQPSWEIPIAAGIYYPSDGPVPERPMRYYRVRCWPGCHTGSDYGKYPQKALNDKPIYPTSTVDAHSKSAANTE
jgi:hypothetical protein